MKVAVGRIEAVDFKLDAWTSGLVEKCLQPLDVRRLLGWMNEALVPNTSRTGRLGHVRSPDKQSGWFVVTLCSGDAQYWPGFEA
jgi:hypothetical protein